MRRRIRVWWLIRTMRVRLQWQKMSARWRGRYFYVLDTEELQFRTGHLSPGDYIHLAPGEYQGPVVFPRLSENVVLDGGGHSVIRCSASVDGDAPVL